VQKEQAREAAPEDRPAPSQHELEKDQTVREALGEHILDNYLRAKRQEWADYISHVHPWEQERYLSEY
jgi:glutamine synthetase